VTLSASLISYSSPCCRWRDRVRGRITPGNEAVSINGVVVDFKKFAKTEPVVFNGPLGETYKGFGSVVNFQSFERKTVANFEHQVLKQVLDQVQFSLCNMQLTEENSLMCYTFSYVFLISRAE
jgi:hypothetical protein